MNFGPSRRSGGRLLSVGTTPSSSFASIDETAPYPPPDPGTPTKSRDNKFLKLRSSWRRVPFSAWIVTISLCCCIVYMRLDAHEGLVKNETIRRLGEDKSEKLPQQEQDPKEQLDDAVENDGIDPGLIHYRYLRQPAIDPEKSIELQFSELVHVVQTRFMQHQSRLLELGLARLALFEAFCLPSMLSQTNGNFLWIIRSDPDLHPLIVDRLQRLLEGRPNFILIGSNNNPEGFGRPMPKLSFESFLRMDNTTAPVWNGNLSLAEEAYERSAAGAVLLETRLDSDDGVNIHYIETIQAEARKNLMVDNSNKTYDLWRLWCIESRLEWHPLSPFPEAPEIIAANQTFPEGYLVYYSEKGCSTPGLTFGYGYGANRESINTALGINHLRHDEISKKIRKCKKKSDGIEVGCVSQLKELQPGAVRARTTTSAGMSNVITGRREFDKRNGFSHIAKNQNFIKQFFQQDNFWIALSRLLSVSNEDVRYARSIILERMQEIALDNLKGQCTGGHSCKNATQSILGKLAGE
ncbi:hypothetical protein ACHAW5_000419 [Stephanodiscus triporus]|uniref:Uncharacterized protein n=1 Tax=Stephanodiscus triporus TaxID=2934178 RepID=A0ABD3MJD9_9STRA